MFIRKTISLDVTELQLDFSGIYYLSSARHRVILSAQKVMNKLCRMIIKNVNKTIIKVFDITGFIDKLTIE